MATKQEYLDAAKLRLEEFGFPIDNTPTSADNNFIAFSVDKVLNMIRHRINDDYIPDGLFEIAVDWIAGEYLFTKNSLGLIDFTDTNIDVDTGSIASVKEGDTTVQYSNNDSETAVISPAIKFKNLLDYLMRGELVDYLRYRKLLW